MNTIQLQRDITFEQYKKAVRVLEEIGIEVATEKMDRSFVLSEEQKKVLDSRTDRSQYRDVDIFLTELQKEYGL